MIGNALAIAAIEAKAACSDEADLLKRLRKAMKATKNHWLITDENERFKAALAGALMATEDEGEKNLIESSAKAMRTLAAMLSGVPVDLAKIETTENTLPLMQLWDETK